jgi:hypothetical protein
MIKLNLGDNPSLNQKFNTFATPLSASEGVYWIQSEVRAQPKSEGGCPENSWLAWSDSECADVMDNSLEWASIQQVGLAERGLWKFVKFVDTSQDSCVTYFIRPYVQNPTSADVCVNFEFQLDYIDKFFHHKMGMLPKARASEGQMQAPGLPTALNPGETWCLEQYGGV